MKTSHPNTPSAVRHSFRFSRALRLSALAVLILGASGATFFASRAFAADKSSAAPAAAPAPKVTVAPVEERTIIDQRELLGRVEAIESVEIRPRVSGHIDQVRLQAGQRVRKGDVLFVIDPRWYQAQFDLATAEVESAKVRVSIAEREARRSDGLLSEHAISVEEADTRTSRLAEARAQQLAAEASLATARLDLEYTEIRSPIEGRVSRAYVTSGNLVSGAPGNATLLTTVMSDGEVYVYADIDEATVLTFNRLSREGRLQTENGRVPVTMQLSDENSFGHRGYIESADNRLDRATGSLVLRMVFANPEGQLLPGLSVRVLLPVSSPERTLLISERAIGTDQSQKFVLTVAKDNTVAYRSVKLGANIEGKRVIREGLNAGDTIIV
ncbi:MAG: efflux RND transporter periplasmic adaptor subunit, partial [Opitutus sp.]